MIDGFEFFGSLDQFVHKEIIIYLMLNNLRVCTIGGGTGMSVVNRALVRAGVRHIRSIVTTFDSGGDTGRMRTDERGNLLAFSDYWRALMSLWVDGEQKQRWEEMLLFRDGRGRNFGNLLFQFLAEKSGDLSKVDMLFASLTKAKLAGIVLPVTVEPADICFRTITGKEYVGEHQLDAQRMSKDVVQKIWLSREVRVNPEVLWALETAEVIIISPGSMYGSILANFLPEGVVEAFKKSLGEKILMTNIMSVANENGGFNQEDYVRVFEKYLKIDSPFELVLMGDIGRLDEKLMIKTKESYELENSGLIKILPNSRYKTEVADIIKIEEKNLRLRHCEKKLTKWFKMHLCHKKRLNSKSR